MFWIVSALWLLGIYACFVIWQWNTGFGPELGLALMVVTPLYVIYAGIRTEKGLKKGRSSGPKLLQLTAILLCAVALRQFGVFSGETLRFWHERPGYEAFVERARVGPCDHGLGHSNKIDVIRCGEHPVVTFEWDRASSNWWGVAFDETDTIGTLSDEQRAADRTLAELPCYSVKRSLGAHYFYIVGVAGCQYERALR